MGFKNLNPLLYIQSLCIGGMNFSFNYQFTDKNSGVCELTWLDYTNLKNLTKQSTMLQVC